MKSQKGMSTIKLIIIIVVIVLGIIFVVAMSKPRNGIGSLKKETKEMEEAQERLRKSNDRTKEAQQNYIDSLTELKEAEEELKKSNR